MATYADDRRESKPARRPPHEPAPATHATERVLTLQQLAGNRAVSQALDTGRTLDILVPAQQHRAATLLDAPGVRARMPTFADLKAAYTDKKLNIPESVVRNAVTQLLGRMAKEGRLTSKDPVASIVAAIFPGPGLIVEAEFNKALDTADRTKVYQSVLDANTTVQTADKASLKALMKDAGDLMSQVEGDAVGLKAVFGTKDAVAKARYASARAALAVVAGDLDKHVTTDYNLDDPEVFMGGWAQNATQMMHLIVGVVKGTDPARSKTTLVHEASHLGDSAVEDFGYYASPAFEAMTDAEKVDNAAHYEELPRRILGTSSYPGHVFVAGTVKGGGTVTRKDTVGRIAREHLRRAWDATVDAHSLLREVRKARLSKNDRAPFKANKALILEISHVCDLTVHRQRATAAQVTPLDVTLMESVARAMNLIGRGVSGEPLPAGPLSDQAAADAMVAEATKKYGELLHDPARDKALVDWFAAHYHVIPVVP